MSDIPGGGDGTWSVILRSRDEKQVVLYNEDQKRVMVRSNATPLIPAATWRLPSGLKKRPINVCSLCKRPFDDDDDVVSMDRNYFNVLDETHREESIAESHPDLSSIKNIPHEIFNQGYYARFFREGRRLGRGARGSVFLAQHVLENEMLGEYAVKKVPVGDNAEWLTRMLKEVHVMEALRHPNIVAYKHTWLEIDKPSPFAPHIPCLFILMEYANGGNLEDYICSEIIDEDGKPFAAGSHSLPAGDILWLFMGICRGLEHLHHFGIIHRDLKPSNILLHYPADRVTRPQVLISDFGECNVNQGVAEAGRTGATGTIEFCAPELFRVDSRGRYLYQHSQKTDVWSLGMILYYMLFGGQLPYADIDNVDVLRQDMLSLQDLPLPELRPEFPPEIRHLLERLLSIEPDQRPGISHIVKVVEKAISALSRGSPHLSKAAFRLPPLLPGAKGSLDRERRSLGSLSAELMASLTVLGIMAHCYPHSVHWSMFLTLLVILVLSRVGLISVRKTAILGSCWFIARMWYARSICSC